MTIALAIKAADGLVMAADTLETADPFKGNEHKIVSVSGTKIEGTCLIAGAGDAGYVDGLTRELAQVFRDKPKLSGRQLINAFERYLMGFYRDHVIPFAPYPENQRPEVEVLFGVHRRAQTILCVSEKTVVRVPIRGDFAAVGIGSEFAGTLYRRLSHQSPFQPPTIAEARLLAAYIVFRTKEAVPDCGNYTTVLTMGAPFTHVEYWPLDEIIDWERMFRGEWTQRQRDQMWGLIAAAPAPQRKPIRIPPTPMP